MKKKPIMILMVILGFFLGMIIYMNLPTVISWLYLLRGNWMLFAVIIILIFLSPIIYFIATSAEARAKLSVFGLFGLIKKERLLDRDKCEEIAREFIENHWLTKSFLEGNGHTLSFLADIISPIYPKAITYHGFMFTCEPVQGGRRIGNVSEITSDRLFGVVVNRNNGEPESKLFNDFTEIQKFVFQKHLMSRVIHEEPEIRKKLEEKVLEGLGIEMGKEIVEKGEVKKEVKEEIKEELKGAS